MSRIRLLIADVDSLFISNVRKAVARHAGIEVVGSANSGGIALKQLALLRPDVLLTDIQLPEVDGTRLIRECCRMDPPIVAVACTHFYSDTCMEYACKCGASYFLYKPIDYDHLPGIIAECCANARAPRRRAELENAQDEARREIAAGVCRMLSDMGIPARLTGGQYLIESVCRLRQDRMLLRNLTRGLYAQIAARHHTSAECVERALRSAIAVGYDRGSMKRWFNYRPTNKELIEFLMRQLDETSIEPIAARMPEALRL